MNMRMFFWVCLLSLGVCTTSCSSDDSVEGTETHEVSFQVTADTGFKSRAVNESDYLNLSNYKIELTKDGQQYRTYNYSDMPTVMALELGSYSVRAYCGEDAAASTTTMLVEGSTDFTLTEVKPDVTMVNVNCTPACAKVIVNFSADMANYFSDYSVKMETAALTAGGVNYVWGKSNTDPVYLKVNTNESVKMTILLTKSSDASQSTVERTYTLSPKDAFTLNINPVEEASTGSLGISITVDESTNDKPIDIVVPNEWWN